jgi:hypothetical protein
MHKPSIFFRFVTHSFGTVASNESIVPAPEDMNMKHLWNGNWQGKPELFQEKSAPLLLCS